MLPETSPDRSSEANHDYRFFGSCVHGVLFVFHNSDNLYNQAPVMNLIVNPVANALELDLVPVRMARVALSRAADPCQNLQRHLAQDLRVVSSSPVDADSY